MSSSPSVLKSRGLVELAVKFSTWAPANWVHTKCTVGDWVTFRFYNYQTSKLLSFDILICSDLAGTFTTR